MILTDKRPDTFGFTLVELLISMAISSLIMAAIYKTYITHSRINVAQESVVEMQQNIRTGLGSLVRDLRLAGFDPAGTANTGFVNGVTFSDGGGLNMVVSSDTTTQVAFTADLDRDGTIDLAAQDANGDGNTDMSDMEQVAYRLNGTNLQRYSTTTGIDQWQTVAEQIERIEFNYLNSDGDPTGVFDDVRSVQITLLAVADRPDRQFLNNTPYTAGSGAVWPAANDNFRRRLLIVTVKCRNMGL